MLPDRRTRLAALLVAVLTVGGLAVALPGHGVPPFGGHDGAAEGAVRGADNCPRGPADPAADTIGWEGGCWANESVVVTRSNGTNRTELDRLVARTKARIETIRGLEFRIDVGVKIVVRTPVEDPPDREVPRARRVRKNLRFEALFVVNESADAVRDAPGASYAGFYAPWEKQVVLYAKPNATASTDEFLLAHELTHALQDDYGNPADTRPRFRDGRTAKSAVVEGVASHVTQTYKRRCRGQWAGTCLPPEGWDPGGDGATGAWCDVEDPPFNIARTHLGLVVYSDGPVFVDRLLDRGGWAAVEDAYGDPPASTEQVIHPGKYPDDAPTNLTLSDESEDHWRVVTPEGDGPTRMELGEVSLYVLFWNQWFLTDHRTEIIPCRSTYRVSHPRDLHNYSHPVSAGWDGDRFLPYASNRTNGTGYVWKVTWDSVRDARQFADAYRRLLAGHDATPVEGRANTYRVPAGSGYADAYYLDRRGDTVLVVNGPTVEALRAIRPAAAPRAEGGRTASATPTPAGRSPTPTPTAKRSPTTTPRTPTGTSDGGRTIPGFGVLVAIAALAALIAVVRARER